jgi:hypothetical protein
MYTKYTQQLTYMLGLSLRLDCSQTFEEAGNGPYISAEEFADLFSELIASDPGITSLLQEGSVISNTAVRAGA